MKRNLERTFKALANKNRLKIISYLKKGPLSVSVIANKIGLSFKSTSKHLQKLEIAGLTERSQKRSFGYYKLSDYSKDNFLKQIFNLLRYSDF